MLSHPAVSGPPRPHGSCTQGGTTSPVVVVVPPESQLLPLESELPPVPVSAPVVDPVGATPVELPVSEIAAVLDESSLDVVDVVSMPAVDAFEVAVMGGSVDTLIVVPPVEVLPPSPRSG